MIPALYTHAIAALVAGALAFGAAWQVQAWRWAAAELALSPLSEIVPQR